MPRSRTRLPDDHCEAISLHLAAAHDGAALDLGEVGRARSRLSVLRVIWDDGPQWTDAWFRCLRCPEGFDRYLVDVDRPEPSQRMLPMVEAHFAQPGHPRFTGPGDLGTQTRVHAGQLAVYAPPWAGDGASLRCRTCQPHGRNPIMLTPPPHGDARRLAYLERRHRDHAVRIAGWASRDRAAYWRALDEGAFDPTPADVRAALDRRHQPAPTQPAGLLHQALLALMRDRHAETGRIDPTIRDLAEQARTDSVAFSCQVDEGLILLGVLPDRPIRATDRAERVRLKLGLPIDHYPTASYSTLYRIWRRR